MSLQLAKKPLEEGDEDRARDIIARHRRTPSDDLEVHYEWGLLCEEIGAFNLARECHESALKLAPRNPEYLCKLACLHRDVGQNEKPMRYATQAVKQDAGNHRTNLNFQADSSSV